MSYNSELSYHRHSIDRHYWDECGSAKSEESVRASFKMRNSFAAVLLLIDLTSAALETALSFLQFRESLVVETCDRHIA
jgi:hypothetical protein